MQRPVHSGGIVQEVVEDSSSCSLPWQASACCACELDAMHMPVVADNDRQSPSPSSCVEIDEVGSGNTLRLSHWSKVSGMTSGSLAVWVAILSCGHGGPNDYR